MTVVPPLHGMPMVPITPPAWNIGVQLRNVLASVKKPNMNPSRYTFSVWLRWVCMTPFGRPVVPPVYISTARSSSATSTTVGDPDATTSP